MSRRHRRNDHSEREEERKIEQKSHEIKTPRRRRCRGCAQQLPPRRKIYCDNQCRMRGEQRNNPTSVEKCLFALLKALKLNFEKQYPIGRYLVDAFVPEYNLVINAHGCQVHGCLCDNMILDGDQKIKRKKDRVRDNNIRDAGYRVITFWEHELKKTPSAARAKILAAINACMCGRCDDQEPEKDDLPIRVRRKERKMEGS